MVKVIKDGKSIELYHHCDGYPEGVGFCLLKVLELYKKNEYTFYINQMIKKGNFEIAFRTHLDIEYYYIMNLDTMTVECMAVDNWDGDMKVLENITLKYDAEKDVNVDEDIFKED